MNLVPVGSEVLALGVAQGNYDIGGGASNAAHVSPLLARYDASGKLLWSNLYAAMPMGPSPSASASLVGVDPQGNLRLDVKRTDAAVDFGNGPLCRIR